jgi:drug/metabolite transporter (DMT)-like permease
MGERGVSTIQTADTPGGAVEQPASVLRAGLAPFVASCLWGGMYVVSRASFGAIPPLTLAALRVAIGGLTLAIVLRALARRAAGNARVASTRPRWRMQDHVRAFGCGLIVAACIATQFLGTDLVSAHDAALLTTVTPVFVVPLAWVLLRERPHLRVVAGMLLALVGVAVVVSAQAGGGSAAAGGTRLLGDGLLLVSALAWALFTVLGTPLTRRFSALAASTYAMLWSIVFLAPLAFVELLTRTPRPVIALTPASVAAVLYLAWGATALAWVLWYRGVARLETGVAAVFFFAQPLVGGLLSGLLLHEPLPAGFWLGGAVLAAGIVVVSSAPARGSAAQNEKGA